MLGWLCGYHWGRTVGSIGGRQNAGEYINYNDTVQNVSGNYIIDIEGITLQSSENKLEISRKLLVETILELYVDNGGRVCEEDIYENLENKGYDLNSIENALMNLES